MKIQNNSIIQAKSLLDFITLIVFKDEIEADANETIESARNAFEYLGAYFKTDDNSEETRAKIISNYKELNPYYANIWTTYNVAPYISRRLKDFDILYENRDMINLDSNLSRYRQIYKQVLTFFYSTTYNKANESKANYRNYCLFIMNIMGYLNYMDKFMENPYDIDVMSEEMIDRFMSSFGITYFSNAPIQYKKRIAKNLNRLITRKGTDQVIVDILDIFDFGNINIFKYYLYKNQSEIKTNEDNEKEIEVFTNPKFISHNIRIPSLSEAIRHDEYRINDIRSITEADDTWQVKDHEINSYNFDFVQTKYFSIESGFELSKQGMGTILILNLLRKIRESYSNKEYMTLTSNVISNNPVQIEDIVLALHILTLEYHGIQDRIQYEIENLYSVYQYAEKDDFTLNNIFKDKDGNLDKSLILEDLTEESKFDQVTINRIIGHNSEVYSKMMDEILSESDYRRYQKLRSLYYSKFSQKLSYEMFKGFTTFSGYLEDASIDVFNFVEKFKHIEDENSKKIEIERAITLLTDILKSYLNDRELFFGSTSIDIMSTYIREVIEVFKSFTVTLRDLTFFIIIKEELDGRLFDYIDNLDGFFKYMEEDDNTLILSDMYIFYKKMFRNDKVYLHDTMNITTKLGIERTKDNVYMTDDLYNLHITFNHKDVINLEDKFKYDVRFMSEDHINFSDNATIYGIFTCKDTLPIHDGFNLKIRLVSDNTKDTISIHDEFNFRQDNMMHLNDQINLCDDFKFGNSMYKVNDTVNVHDMYKFQSIIYKASYELTKIVDMVRLRSRLKVKSSIHLHDSFTIKTIE